MANYCVAFVRKEITYERYYVNVEADSEAEALERTRLHYMEGESVLTEDEESTEYHSKTLDCDGGDVVEILWATKDD